MRERDWPSVRAVRRRDEHAAIAKRIAGLRQAIASGFARVVLPVLAIAACGDPTVPPDAVPVEFRELEDATRSGLNPSFNASLRQVIQRPSDFSAFWTALWVGAQRPQPPEPDIDFAVSRVVVAALGVRGSTGYEVRVRGVFVQKSEYFVVVRERRPGLRCVTGAAETEPVTAVVVSGLFAEATFVEEVEVFECGGA